jgi:hypothetical protein
MYDLTPATVFLFGDIFIKGDWQTAFPFGSTTDPDWFESNMRIAVTLKAVKPWGVAAIHPQSLTQAICPLLQVIFPASPNKTITLIRKFRELPQHCRFDVPGWTRSSMDQALNSLSAVNSQNFSGLSSRCSLYYDAMVFVFCQNGIDLDSASTGLAAWGAALYRGNTDGTAFRAALRERLNGSPTAELEYWAYEILATYLIAWLRDSSTIEEDFRSKFRRRVFLG